MGPSIGITVHAFDQEAHQGELEARYLLAGQYARAVALAGGVPLLVPTRAAYAAAPETVLGALDGLLFSGGGNLPAGAFEGDRSPTLRETNPERYDYEVALARAARERGLPMLGICRGLQTLVEAAGGSLLTNLERIPAFRGRHYQAAPPRVRTHEIRLESSSVLGRALPGAAPVNSFHRQAVEHVPDGYRVAAYSDDGLIEAVEAIDERVMGTQFHPEWLAEDEPVFLAPFAWLVERAAAGRHG